MTSKMELEIHRSGVATATCDGLNTKPLVSLFGFVDRKGVFLADLGGQVFSAPRDLHESTGILATGHRAACVHARDSKQDGILVKFAAAESYWIGR